MVILRIFVFKIRKKNDIWCTFYLEKIQWSNIREIFDFIKNCWYDVDIKVTKVLDRKSFSNFCYLTNF